MKAQDCQGRVYSSSPASSLPVYAVWAISRELCQICRQISAASITLPALASHTLRHRTRHPRPQLPAAWHGCVSMSSHGSSPGRGQPRLQPLKEAAERQEAERAAWAAPGVTKVENHITVEP
jgi:hypothetical protein